jgi:outer membrane protein OmpU
MRKLLLTSTALVAASSIANYATADVAVTGAFEWGYTSQAADVTSKDGDSFRQDNEVTVTFTSKTDSGLSLTGRWYVDADDGNDAPTGESSLAIAGGFGKIVLGSDDDAADAFGVHEQDLIGEESSSVGASASILTNAGESGNGDDNKITYFTPAMGGFKAGISTTDSGTAGVTDRTTMGASYSMPMEGGSLLVEYNQGKTDGETDTDHQNYGATLTMGAMSVIVSSATKEYASNDIEAVGMGIKYDMGGGMYIAAATMEAEDDHADATSGGEKEKYNTSMAEVGYTIAPGLNAAVTYVDYEYKDGGTATTAADDSGSITKLTIKAAF